MSESLPAINLDADISFLMDLLRLPSPSGYIEPARQCTLTELTGLGLESRVLPNGAVVALLKGAGKAAPRCLLAHLDVLGMMVKRVETDGMLTPEPVGGFRAATVEGEYVTIHTLQRGCYSGTIVPLKGSAHVFGDEGDEKRVFKDLRIRLDEKVNNLTDVEKLGIRVGDYVTIDPRPVLTSSGYIKGRGLDDKVGVAAAIGAIRAIKSAGLVSSGDIWLYFTEQEEGGYAVPGGLPADMEEILALDMGVVGLGQTGSEHKCSICAKDSRGVYSRIMVERLVKLSEKFGIASVVDLYPRYGSEAWTAALAGPSAARAGLIGPGVACSHAYERTHTEGMEATLKLVLAYLLEG